MIFYIYGLIDPITKELRYIGRTSNHKERLRNHMSPYKLRTFNSHKNSWIKSLIKNNERPIMYIIEEQDSFERSVDAEKFFIEYFRSIGCNLTNATDGGVGTVGIKRSEETKKRISLAGLGRKHTKETKKRISEKLLGIKKSEAFKQNLREINTGKKMSAEAILRMSESQKGKKISQKSIEKQQATFKKLGYYIKWRKLSEDQVSDIIKIYSEGVESLQSLAVKFNVSQSLIHKIIKNNGYK